MSVDAEVSHQTAATEFVDCNGVRLACRRFGAATGVPLVFLQHFRGTMDNWDPLVIDGLAANRPVILLDNRGIGRSTGITPDTVVEMSKDIVAFVEALGLAQFDVLGFSLGGIVAQQIMFDRPELVRRAILVGTGGPGAAGMIAGEVVTAATMYPGDAKAILFLFFSPTKSSQAAGIEYLKRMSARSEREPAPTQHVMWAQLEAIREWGQINFTARARLGKIKSPTLVVNGNHDIMIPTANSVSLRQEIRNSELILYPDAGHGSLFQYPEKFVSDASRFLVAD